MYTLFVILLLLFVVLKIFNIFVLTWLELIGGAALMFIVLTFIETFI